MLSHVYATDALQWNADVCAGSYRPIQEIDSFHRHSDHIKVRDADTRDTVSRQRLRASPTVFTANRCHCVCRSSLCWNHPVLSTCLNRRGHWEGCLSRRGHGLVDRCTPLQRQAALEYRRAQDGQPVNRAAKMSPKLTVAIKLRFVPPALRRHLLTDDCLCIHAHAARVPRA